MERTPSKKELTHARIVETAGRAIRRGGFQGVGVADIMKEAGLTHGGFYAHFASRDALLAEAVECVGRQTAAQIDAAEAKTVDDGRSPFRRFVERYLSDRHLAAIEQGCPVAALVSEVPRQADVVREAAAARVRGLVAAVRLALPGSAPAGTAEAVAAHLVGALQLARAFGDNAEGREMLAASRQALLQQHDPAG